MTRASKMKEPVDASAPREISQKLRRRAAELGFTLVGVCPAVAPPGAARLDEWLARGYAGDMHYLAERRDAYSHPKHVLDGVRSILMLGMPYQIEHPAVPAPNTPGQGRIARYAWGNADYHEVIHGHLHNLADYFRELVPGGATRGVVDTAPLLEREFAQLAGLGWIGKNTLLLNRTAGSYFFLAALLTDQELEYDAPHAADHCGTCTACLTACPTQAFPQPYVLDASRCISYLTIEHKGKIQVELRPGLGDWLFGCDVCQDVCPWNAHATKKVSGTDSGEFLLSRREGPAEGFPTTLSGQTIESGIVPTAASLPTATSDSLPSVVGSSSIDLISLLELTEADFRQRFRHTPLWRPHRRGLLRNAAIVLGNQRHTHAVPALTRGLRDDEPLVRDACAWALGQIDSHDARAALSTHLGAPSGA
jgi:epoxyqueuosine reductase